MTKRRDSPQQFALDPVQDVLYQALKEWRNERTTASPLAHLQTFQNLQRRSQASARALTNQLLLQLLEVLAIEHPEDAQLLRQRFLDNELAYHVANTRNVSEATIYRQQGEALERLAVTLRQQEATAQLAQQKWLLGRLEAPTYSRLLDRATKLEKLTKLLMPDAEPWLVAITGLGGIGKTALADALLRGLIAQGVWPEIGWLTARQQVFNLGGAIKPATQPVLTVESLVRQLVAQLWDAAERPTILTHQQALAMLNKRLRETPHLIVIDNLETVTDLEALLPLLRCVANPTKFLLTTRESLFAEPEIAHENVPELTAEAAIRLVRQEAQARNLPYVLEASDDELRPIYATVGGNPLALRLVVGQLHVHDLAEVLAELTAARGAKAGDLYEFVYRHAWENLDETARQTLIAMLMVPEQGGAFDFLRHVNPALAPDALHLALDQLVTLNLVDRRGGLNGARYSIHGLTRTFLHTLAQW